MRPFLLAVFTCFILLFSFQAHTEDILIINSGNASDHNSHDINNALKTTLTAYLPGKNFSFFVENLDSPRIDFNKNRDQYQALLSNKYNNFDFYLIFTIGPEAVKFVNQLNKPAFITPKTISIGAFGIKPSSLRDNITILPLNIKDNIINTTDIARKLFPKSNQILLLNDNTPKGNAVQELMVSILKNKTGITTSEIFKGKPYKDLLTSLYNQSENSIILLGCYEYAPSKPKLSPNELINEIRSNSSSPIFSIYPTPINYGALGGFVQDYYRLGEAAVYLGLEKNGFKDLPKITLPSSPLFDNIQLRIFDLQVNQLPDNTILLNSNLTELTAEEREWLQSRQFLTYSLNPDFAPFGFLNNKQEIDGIAADYLKLLRKKLKVNFEPQIYKNWSETLLHAKQKEIDIILTATKTKDRQKYLNFTTPYFEIPTLVLVNSSQKPSSKGTMPFKKVAVIKGTAVHEYLKETKPSLQLVPIDKASKALRMLAGKELEALVINQATAFYYINKEGLSNLTIFDELPFKNQLSFASRKDWPRLNDILNKAIHSISKEDHQTIRNKWITVGYRAPVITKFTVYSIITFTSFIVFMLIIGWIWILKRQVLNRTAELSTELQNRRSAEHMLLNSEKKYKALFANSNDAMFLLNEGVIIDCNRAALRMLRCHSKTEIINSHPWNFSPDYQPCSRNSEQLFKEYYLLSLSTGSHRFEWQCLRKNQKDFPAEGMLTHIQLDNRDLMHLVWRDITKRKLSEQRLAKANTHLAEQAETLRKEINERRQTESLLIEAKSAAEDANRAKSEFLSNMSHEIRSPMNAILGFTEILHDQTRSEKQRMYLHAIKESGKNMLAMVNDILDLSKLEAGKMDLEPGNTHLHEIADEMRQIFTPELKNKNVDFQLALSPDLPYTVIIDEIRLRQVLYNLIENAVKFTESGFVRLEINTETKDSNGALDITIVIQDTGIGIPPEQQNTIFDAFVHQPGLTHVKFGGTGLGLAITKRLVEMMNGNVTLSSTIGLGTRFIISLRDVPVNTEEEMVKPPETTTPSVIFHPQRPILIADDIELNRELLKGYLEDYKFSFLEATNGKEAVEACQKHNPLLIIMDLKMPYMDGYEASQIIKNLPGLSETPIIAVSATDSLVGDNKSCFETLLKKPVSKAQLIELLQKFIPYENSKQESKELVD